MTQGFSVNAQLKETDLYKTFQAAVQTSRKGTTAQSIFERVNKKDTNGVATDNELDAEEMAAAIKLIAEENNKNNTDNREVHNKDRYRGEQAVRDKKQADIDAFNGINNDTINYDWKGRKGDNQEKERTEQINNGKRDARESTRVILDWAVRNNKIADLLEAAKKKSTQTKPTTPTADPEPTPPAAPTHASDSTPTPTPTPTSDSTPTPTPTPAADSTPTPTPTPAADSTPTPTPTPASDSTPTPPPTPAPESTPTQAGELSYQQKSNIESTIKHYRVQNRYSPEERMKAINDHIRGLKTQEERDYAISYMLKDEFERPDIRQAAIQNITTENYPTIAKQLAENNTCLSKIINNMAEPYKSAAVRHLKDLGITY